MAPKMNLTIRCNVLPLFDLFLFFIITWLMIDLFLEVITILLAYFTAKKQEVYIYTITSCIVIKSTMFLSFEILLVTSFQLKVLIHKFECKYFSATVNKGIYGKYRYF